ncbi:MAG TPA: hypothetical protein PLI53_09585 [Geobacteraceae bacterium]|nr:hypothetical protein [Geobacteraceae bacterium]
MDQLRMFSELVEAVESKGMRLDEFRLLVLLFVNYDAHRKVGKIRLDSLAAVSGGRNSRVRAYRSLCILSEFGFIQILSRKPKITCDVDYVLYRILFAKRKR